MIKIYFRSLFFFTLLLSSVMLVSGCRETLLPADKALVSDNFEDDTPDDDFDLPPVIDPNPDNPNQSLQAWSEAHQGLQDVFSKLVTEGDGYTQFYYRALVDGRPELNDSLRGKLDSYFKYTNDFDPRRLLGPSSSNEERRFKKAFWINFYNACTVNIVSKNYDEIVSAREGLHSLGIWSRPLCKIGGGLLSLDQVEHAILRNGEARGELRSSSPKALPARLKANHDFFDYRIHFAVNCASASCPQLSRIVFSSRNVDALLEKLEKDFWTIGKEAVSPHLPQARLNNKTLKINPIIGSWYSVDFPDDLAVYISRFTRLPNGTRVSTFSYSWKPNEAPSPSNGHSIIYQEDWHL